MKQRLLYATLLFSIGCGTTDGEILETRDAGPSGTNRDAGTDTG